MNPIIAEAVRETGDASSIETVRMVSGGEINEAFCVGTENREYFVKLNRETSADFFQWEARGLELMRESYGSAVDRVLKQFIG